MCLKAQVNLSLLLFSQTTVEEKKKQIKKYTVKPPKDLRSKFEIKMEARRVAEEKAEEDKRRAEEEQKNAVCMMFL